MSGKSVILLANIPVSANGVVAWRLVSGVAPYQATFSCHKSDWPKLQEQKGRPITMEVRNSRQSMQIKSLFITHEVASDSPNRRSFVVADRRWRWEYRLVTKDYNMVRRTANKVLIGAVAVDAPVEISQSKDEYYYLPYSLDDGKRWTPRSFLEDVFAYVEPYSSRIIESFPEFGQGTGQNAGGGDQGGVSIQNMMLRDQGNIAMQKALQACPGADVYVRFDGSVAVFDAVSEGRTKEVIREAGLATWEGDALAKSDKRKIRPKNVVVHFQREVELVLAYSDDFGAEGQTVETKRRDKNGLYVENVMPTVDPETEVTEYDPVLDKMVTKTVGQGTFVEFKALLDAWDKKKPSGAEPWTFETIRKVWLHGDMDGILGGANGLDLDPLGNVVTRIQMIKQHFRQTFRVNQRIMERVRDIQPTRVFVLDPVTGLRSPSLVWGQACVISTTKGQMIASRTDPEKTLVMKNVDYYPKEGKQIKDTPPGPTRLIMLDRDRGLFRTEWIVSPYGIVESFVPGFITDSYNNPRSAVRNLKEQDRKPMASGVRSYAEDNSIFLGRQCSMKMIVTMVPCAPNDSRQFHIERIAPDKIALQFAAPFSMVNGQGPDYHVFVPPNEVTARFGWFDDEQAEETALKLLGLYDDPETREDESEEGPDSAGVKDDPSTKVDESKELPGYEFLNKQANITAYAESVAAGVLVPFADGMNGTLVTDLQPNATIKGKMGGVTVVASAAPSGRVNTMFDFPGTPRPIDSRAFLPMDTRMLLMGIVPFTKPGG